MRTTALLTLAVFMPSQVMAASVLPTGGQVVAGSASIATGANSVTVNQSSNAAIVNWNSFSIGAGNSVQFNNGSGATLSRVTGNISSLIDGSLSATGSLYLVNPAGVVVGAGGTVTTGGSFIASTHDISNGDFLNGGAAEFSGASNAEIVNNGTISSANGDVALIARKVDNAGTISTPNGTTALAAGYDVLMRDASGTDGKFAVKVGGSDTAVVNSGTIRAAEVEMRANGGNVYALAGNTNSIVKATGVSSHGGRVFLTAGGGKVTVARTARISAQKPVVVADVPTPVAAPTFRGGEVTITGGTVSLAGTIDVSGQGAGTSGGTITVIASGQGTYAGDLLARGGEGGSGGTVETSGHTVDFTGLSVDTSATNGSAGLWLVDPQDLTVDAASAATIAANLATTSVTLQTTATTASGPGVVSTGNGDITIDSAISWASANTLTLNAYNNININAAITGTSGGLTLTTPAGKAISATDAISVGTFLLTNGQFSQISASLPSFSAHDFQVQYGSFLRATGGTGTSADPYLLADVYGLQGMANLTSSSFSLANDIDASGTANWNSGAGFVPIGSSTGANYAGTFNGQNHTVTGLTINRPSTGWVGLFGVSKGVIKNVGLIGGSIVGNGSVGALAGESYGGGSISHAYSTASVSGAGYVGGLVGANTGSISHSHATGDVTSTGNGAGGLVGLSDVGTISYSYASGNVSGTGYVGGLVGNSGATISYSYATGDVTGTGNYVGGLVGNYGAGTISYAYSTGAVTGANQVGGLVGYNNTGTVSQAYASGAVSGATDVGGLIGLFKPGTSGATVSQSYFDAGTTGQSAGIGTDLGTGSDVTALTTAEARTRTSYSAFDFTGSGAWYMIDGETRPFLRSEYSTTITNAHQLQLMAMDLTASYTLAANIDALATSGGNASDMWTSAGFVPVGNSTTAFTGSFDGQGHTVTGLTINRPSTNDVGLFGYTGTGASIDNLTLADVNIAGHTEVAGLVGYNNGGVTNVSVSGSVTGGLYDVGGVAGTNDTGSISEAQSSASVSGSTQVGGLVGSSGGTISQSFATGSVRASPSGGNAGGLVGTLSGNVKISNSYSTASVSAGGAGGLIGRIYNGTPTLTNVWSSGAVSGAVTGGVIGQADSSPTMSGVYWDKGTTGMTVACGSGTCSGATGETSAALQGTLPVGFGSSVWGTGTGLYPYLKWKYATTPVAVTGTAYSDGGSTALSGATVTAVSNGAALGSAATGANGYYYILASSGALGSAGALAYLDGQSNQAASFKDNVSTSGVTGLNIYGTALNVSTSETSLTATLANLSATIGSYSASDLGFISAGTPTALTASGHDINLTAASAYTLDTDLSSGGALSLSAAGNLTLNNAVGWGSTKALSLTTTNGGNIVLNTAVNAPLATLDISAAGTVSADAIFVNTFNLKRTAPGPRSAARCRPSRRTISSSIPPMPAS